MKKKLLPVMSVIAGMLLWGTAQKITNRKQEKARESGNHIPYGIYDAMIKRPLDAVLAGTALLLASPVMGIVAVFVKKRLGTPIIFKQDRPGLNEKIFTIFKYRTMTDQKGADGKLLSDDVRLTTFGKFLRSTSLDELPELINIIKGDMAIVGPRPLLVEYLPRYDELQKHRHDVRPGLTGLAQISGRNSLSWDKKFEDDIKYIEKITFLGDLAIVLKTIAVVLRRSGISSETSVTMDVFMG